MTRKPPPSEYKTVLNALGEINAGYFASIKKEAERLLKEAAPQPGRGRKKKGTSSADRLASAVSLVEQCQVHFVPPPAALIRLLNKVTKTEAAPKDDKPQLSVKQWEAIDYLMSLRSFRLSQYWKDDALPVKLSASQVAEKLNTSHQTIMKWWRDPEFRRGIIHRLASKLTERLPRRIRRLGRNGNSNS